MKRLTAWATLAALCALMLCGGGAEAQKAPTTLDAYVLPTTADTASVLLKVPTAGRTLRVLNITMFYSNAANTNPIYVGIVTADQAHTRYLWTGKTMISSGKETLVYPIVRTLPAAIAQAGVQLFVSATASDTLAASVEYEIDFDHPAF